MALPTFSTAMAMSAMQFGIVLGPMIVYGAIRRSKEIWLASMLTFALGLVVAAILFTPNFGWLANLQYNWLQKALACLCVLFLPSRFGFDRNACGFVLPKGGSALAIGLLIGFVFAVVDFLMAVEHSIPNFETMLFELTMPGMQEEPLYRGLLLCILGQVFGTSLEGFWSPIRCGLADHDSAVHRRPFSCARPKLASNAKSRSERVG